jgi:hypothetical protein
VLVLAVSVIVAMGVGATHSGVMWDRRFRRYMELSNQVGEDGLSAAGRWTMKAFEFPHRALTKSEANLYGRSVMKQIVDAEDREIKRMDDGGTWVRSRRKNGTLIFRKGGELQGFDGWEATRIVYGLKSRDGETVCRGCASGRGTPDEVLAERMAHDLLKREYPGLVPVIESVEYVGKPEDGALK